MVLNPDERHFLSLGINKPFPNFIVTEEKIIGIVMDNNLNFKSHMKKICGKASQKLSAIARVSELTTPTQREKLILLIILSMHN